MNDFVYTMNYISYKIVSLKRECIRKEPNKQIITKITNEINDIKIYIFFSKINDDDIYFLTDEGKSISYIRNRRNTKDRIGISYEKLNEMIGSEFVVTGYRNNLPEFDYFEITRLINYIAQQVEDFDEIEKIMFYVDTEFDFINDLTFDISSDKKPEVIYNKAAQSILKQLDNILDNYTLYFAMKNSYASKSSSCFLWFFSIIRQLGIVTVNPKQINDFMKLPPTKYTVTIIKVFESILEKMLTYTDKKSFNYYIRTYYDSEISNLSNRILTYGNGNSKHLRSYIITCIANYLIKIPTGNPEYNVTAEDIKTKYNISPQNLTKIILTTI